MKGKMIRYNRFTIYDLIIDAKETTTFASRKKFPVYELPFERFN